MKGPETLILQHSSEAQESWLNAHSLAILAAAALHPSESCGALACRQARMALIRSTLAQNFWISAAQADRTLARCSDLVVVSAPPLAGAGSSGAATDTLAPSFRRENPVVTTRSPALMPLAITDCVSDCCATVIGRR